MIVFLDVMQMCTRYFDILNDMDIWLLDIFFSSNIKLDFTSYALIHISKRKFCKPESIFSVSRMKKRKQRRHENLVFESESICL